MRRLAYCAAMIAAAGCTTKDAATTDTAQRAAPAATAAVAADSANRPMAMAGMPMTGDPDHDFLRMMSDHDKGLIAMAHETTNSKELLGVKPLAKRLDAEQDKEIETISDMLDSAFKDPYTPMIMPDDQARLDSLTGKTGTAYDRTFLANVIAHHQRGIAMIDAYLPTGKMAALKSMAAAMKATQQREITELQARLRSPGS